MSNEKTTWRVERLAAQYKEGITAMAGGDVPPQLTPQYVWNVIDDFVRAAKQDRLVAYNEGKCDALLAANTANEEIRRGLLVEMRYLRMGGTV